MRVTHPVLDILQSRLDDGSTPGQRSDPHRVAVVIEGGGMRGVVSAGMTAALERLGLTRCFDLDAERHQRTISSPIPLHCVALDVDSTRLVEFSGMRTKDELWNVLLATTRMPWVGGAPVPISGRRYIDGALTCPIPVGNALEAGATHVLVLQTRP